MKTLTVVAASLAFFCLAARPARAQGCCGSGPAFHAYCGLGCGSTILYTCNEGANNDYMAPAYVCGACNVEDDIPAGYCYDGVVSSLSPVARAVASKSGGTSIYVNAYVRNCRGRYVALRMAMARQAS